MVGTKRTWALLVLVAVFAGLLYTGASATAAKAGGNEGEVEVSWILDESFNDFTAEQLQKLVSKDHRSLFPQTLGSQCGRWHQVDVYDISTKQKKATFEAVVADGILTYGEDFSIYKSHRWVKGEDCVEETTTTTIPEVTPFCEAYTVTIPADSESVAYGLGRFTAGWVLEPADADDLEVGVTYTVFSEVDEGFERDALPQGWVEVDDKVAYFNFTTEEEVCSYEVPPVTAQVIVVTTTTTLPEQETTTTTEPEQETTTTTEPEQETTTTVVEEETTTTVVEAPTTTVAEPEPEAPTELPYTGAGDLLPFGIVGVLLALLGGGLVTATRRSN